MHTLPVITILTLTLSACASTARPRGSIPPSDEDLYQTAAALYQKALETNDRDTYERAIVVYERLLSDHPETPRLYEAIYHDGEARYATKDWAAAAVLYRRAIAMRPRDPRSREMAYSQVLATRHAQGIEGDDDPQCVVTSAEKTPASPLPDAAVPIVAAYDLYLAIVDDAPERPAVLFRKARILYSCGDYPHAEPLLAEIADRWVTAPVAAPAAALLLDCLVSQDKTEAMFERAGALERGRLAHDPVLVDILERIRKARTSIRQPGMPGE